MWRASQLHASRGSDTVPTGHARLDDLIGGWPSDGITELLCDARGIGELRLLLPAIARLSRASRWVAWVNPPWIPYAPALAAAGVDIDHMLMIRPGTHTDHLWTLEQALASGNCSAVLAWPEDPRLRGRDIQRLRLAARKGGTALFLFRSERALQVPSAADLRLQLRPPRSSAAEQVLDLRVLKRPSGWGSEFFQLELEGPNPLATTRDHVQAQLERWRRGQPERNVRPVRQPLRSTAPLSRNDDDRARVPATRALH